MARPGPKPKQPADNPLSQFLRRWLDEHGLSRDQAAKRWGISHGTLRNIEADADNVTGKPNKPKLATLRQLAAGMGVPLETLLALQGGEAELPPVTRAEDPLVGAVGEMLEHKVLDLYSRHLALSRDAVRELLAEFKDIEFHLGDLRQRSYEHQIGPWDRKKLRTQVTALRKQMTRSLQPLEMLADGLAELLPAIRDKVEPDVVQYAEQLLRGIKHALFENVEWEPEVDFAPLFVVPELATWQSNVPAVQPRELSTDVGVLVPIWQWRRRHPHPSRDLEYPGAISAGTGFYTDDEKFEGVISDDDAEGTDYVMRVSGDSLIDANIIEGDLLFLVRTVQVRQGDLVAAWLADGTRTVKFYELDNGQPVLKPANTRYPMIPLTEGCEIRAKVVRIRRDLK